MEGLKLTQFSLGPHESGSQNAEGVEDEKAESNQ